jgi:hypothetical protein
LHLGCFRMYTLFQSQVTMFSLFCMFHASWCYGPVTNKWRITRQDKFYWSINWCWSVEGLFLRLSPFITLNHTSPKIS